ncbi:MAG: type VI secretion system domain-containing protein, partial [Deltaproteobacteria bacterium]|nr:type VI secretion system domain-containing protein [Deltaproteobacteria bacterium]
MAMDFKLTAKDGALVAAIEGLSTSGDADLRARFGDQFPGMSKIRDACRHLARTVPKEAAPPPPKPAPSSAAAPPQAPPPVGPPGAAAPVPPPPLVVAADGPAVNPRAITDATAAKRAVSGLGQLLMGMGGAMRAGRPEDPDAYRFSRWGMWLEVVQAPPVTDGKSLVPPPPAGLRQRFDGLAAAEDWLTLLNEADNAAAQHILWLDPHRHVATAMDRLGALFLKAKKALLTEVALLLLRVPTLPQLAFSNGEPFAGGPTRMWLDAEVKPALGGGPGGPERGGGGGPSVLDEPLQKAQGLVVAGKLAEAVELVGRAAAAAPIPAERFRGKLALAQLCLRAGKFDVARAQLHGLCAQIEEHRLVDWEPGLCAEVYAALFAAHKGANVGPQIPADLLA